MAGYYAVHSGEVLECVFESDAREAALYVICRAFIDRSLLALHDDVHVKSEDGTLSIFDLKQLMAETGGVRIVPQN